MSDVQDKKVVIMGLGLHGGGLAAAQWFFKHGARVCVTDIKTADQLRVSIGKLQSFSEEYAQTRTAGLFHPIEYVLGGHRTEDFRSADLIIQNPGVPSNSEYIGIARSAHIPIENEVSFFFLLTPNIRKIGVTGTKGKSTTTMLIYEILKRQYPDMFVVGVATPQGSIGYFEILDDILEQQEKKSDSPIVMELSSWQLEFLEPHQLSPHIAVITNIMADHLNRYAGMEQYSDAKKNIYLFQKDSDVVILNYDNAATRRIGEEGVPARRLYFTCSDYSAMVGAFIKKEKDGADMIVITDGERYEQFCPTSIVTLPGDHMVQNILAALLVAHEYGIPSPIACRAVHEFKGMQGRLEYIGECKGRTFYNDTTATTPDACNAALRALDPNGRRNIILIAGGADKNLSFDPLVPLLEKTVFSIILLSGTATPNLASAIMKSNFSGHVDMANSMKEAVSKAWQYSREGDSIVLSPACASYGMFIHEFDRGSQFINEIQHLF